MVSGTMGLWAAVAVSLSVGADAPATAPAGGKAYTIKLSRPSKVGDRYRLMTRGSDHNSLVVKANGQTVQQENEALGVQLVGVVTVLAVDQQGAVLKKSILIEKFVMTKNGTTSRPLAKGSVVIAESQGGKKVLSLQGGKLSDDAEKALGPVITVKTSKNTADDAFGSKTPRRVGETWPVNANSIARGLGERLGLAAESIKGQVKLVGVADVDGVACLHITGGMTCDRFKSPVPGLTPAKGSQIEISFSGQFPIDTAIRQLGDKLSFSFKLVGTVEPEPGRKATVDLTQTANMESRSTPLE